MRWSKAPLPFLGQKRYFLKEIEHILKAYHAFVDDKNFKVIDVFGGSGLVARTIKDALPFNDVVYNDFDLYQNRIKNVRHTDGVWHLLNKELRGCEYERKIDGTTYDAIKAIIQSLPEDSDWLTISSWLLFSGNYYHSKDEFLTHFEKGCNIYNNLIKSELDCEAIERYLDGLDIISLDFLRVLELNRNENAVYVLDPPYIQTMVDGYKHQSFSLLNFLDMIFELNNQNKPCIIFGSDKSEMMMIIDKFIQNNTLNNFKNYQILHKNTGRQTYNSKNKNEFLLLNNFKYIQL